VDELGLTIPGPVGLMARTYSPPVAAQFLDPADMEMIKELDNTWWMLMIANSQGREKCQ